MSKNLLKKDMLEKIDINNEKGEKIAEVHLWSFDSPKSGEVFVAKFYGVTFLTQTYLFRATFPEYDANILTKYFNKRLLKIEKNKIKKEMNV